MTKPFSPRELVLRVKSVLRRGSAGAERGAVEGRPHRGRPRPALRAVGPRPVELTATEFKLISLLIERRGQVQSRDSLLSEVWGYESAIDTRTVDTHVRRLRDKLGEEPPSASRPSAGSAIASRKTRRPRSARRAGRECGHPFYLVLLKVAPGALVAPRIRVILRPENTKSY